MPPSTLSAELRTIIARQALSAYAVARRAGVSPRIVQRWLAGERDIRLRTADRLAIVLGARLVEAGPRRRGAQPPPGPLEVADVGTIAATEVQDARSPVSTQ